MRGLKVVLTEKLASILRQLARHRRKELKPASLMFVAAYFSQTQPSEKNGTVWFCFSSTCRRIALQFNQSRALGPVKTRRCNNFFFFTAFADVSTYTLSVCLSLCLSVFLSVAVSQSECVCVCGVRLRALCVCVCVCVCVCM